MMIIGEAPGEDEDREGVPFCGSTGRMLYVLCRQAGFRRDECYITNVVKHRPPSNNISAVSWDNLSKQYELLWEEIKLVQPNIIVPLGETALNAFAKEGITDWRGSLLEWNGFKVLPTYHPSYLFNFRAPEMWTVVVEDLRKAWRFSDTPNYAAPVRDYRKYPTRGEWEHWVESVKPNEPMVVDIETLEEDWSDIRLLGFSNKTRFAICVPPDPDFVPGLLTLMNKPLRWIQQNSFFDEDKIENTFGIRLVPFYDTMLAHHLIAHFLPHNLGFMGSMYTDMPYWKHHAGEDLRHYNCEDCDGTFQVYEGQMMDLGKYKMLPLLRLVMRNQKVVYKMRRRGICFNTPKCEKVGSKYMNKAAELLCEMQHLVGIKYLNPDSPQEMADVLYNKLNLAKQFRVDKHTREKKVTTNKKALDKLMEENPNLPFMKCLKEYRHLVKMVRTYIPKEFEMVGEGLGIAYFDWKMNGTETGRYSSHVHTYPPEMRWVIVPRPGYKLGYYDYSQLEFRIDMYESQDPIGMELLNSGGDIHRMCAAKAFKKPPEDISGLERFMAKFVVHGCRYGRGAEDVAKQFGCSIPEAEGIIETVLGPFRRYMEFRDAQVDHVRQHGWLANWIGRRRYWPKGVNVPEVYNFRPQSGGHDILMFAAAEVEEQLGDQVHIIADMHDGLLTEEPIEDTDGTLCKRVGELMGMEYMPGLSVPGKGENAMNWGVLDDRYTPEGEWAFLKEE
jgi:uracil-DNA glycosylase family 4